MFTTIELFAGAGGLALGVEKAGFKTLGLIEFDRNACDTLIKNRPEWNVICDDIANISKLDLEKYFNITGKTGNKEGTLYYNPATQTAEQNVTYLMTTQNSAISQYLL